MGKAIAETLDSQGATVIFVTGPVAELPNLKNGKIINVKTAEEMFRAAMEYFPLSHGAILAAAVADFKAEKTSEQKIKRTSDNLTITLVPNPDIAAALGKIKKPNQFLVGFALEIENEIENAKQKLHHKNLDLIVLNSLKDPGAGFGHLTNKVTLVTREGNVVSFPLKSKEEVAKDILQAILENNLIQSQATNNS